MPNVEAKLSTFFGDVGCWLKKNALPILLVFLAAALLYYPVWVYNLQNPDSLWIGDHYIADRWDYISMWESSQGRWALTLVDRLRNGFNDAGVLTRLPALLFFAVGAQLATDLLGLRSCALRMLTPVLLVCNPCVFEILTFRYCCASYALSFLLAAVCVVAVVRLPRLAGVAVGGVCLVLSLGLYQSNLAFAAALGLSVVLLRLLREPAQAKAHVTLLLWMFVMAACSLAVYCAVMVARLTLYGVGLATYSGANQFGAAHILTALPLGIVRSYVHTFDFFFTQNLVANRFGTSKIYLALLLLGALSAALWLLRSRKALGRCGVLAALAELFLLPSALDYMSLIIPGSTISPRTSLGMMLVVPLSLALAEGALRRASGKLQLATGTAAVLAGCLLWGYTLQAVTNQQVMRDHKALYKSVAAQVYSAVQTQPESTTLPLLVTGMVPNEEFPEPSHFIEQADVIPASGISWYGRGFANFACWQNFYREEMGLALNWCTAEQAAAVEAADAFAAMPCYPAQGSVDTVTVDGQEILVVKLSE